MEYFPDALNLFHTSVWEGNQDLERGPIQEREREKKKDLMCLDKPCCLSHSNQTRFVNGGGWGGGALWGRGAALGAHHHPVESVMVLNCSLAKAGQE